MVDGSMNGYIASKFFSRRQIVLVRQEHQIQRSYDSRPRNTEMTLADFASFPSPLPRANFPSRRPSKKLLLQPTRKGKPHITAFKIGPQEIAELAHNKVLVASALSCAIGQISKPFTSAVNGNGVDLKAAIQSGGMPSTHSAGVAAAATSLGLERGFSDSIFGVSVIFAALVMYDAQGVRREVGYHAKILNELITVRPDLESKSLTARVSSDEDGGDLYVSETLDSYVGKSQPCRVNSYEVATTKLASLANSKPDTKESPQKCHSSFTRLNESVGHNEIQVIIGALLGFIVSLAVDSIL